LLLTASRNFEVFLSFFFQLETIPKLFEVAFLHSILIIIIIIILIIIIIIIIIFIYIKSINVFSYS